MGLESGHRYRTQNTRRGRVPCAPIGSGGNGTFSGPLQGVQGGSSLILVNMKCGEEVALIMTMRGNKRKKCKCESPYTSHFSLTTMT